MQNKSSIFSLFALLSIVATSIELYANVIIEKDIAQGLVYVADIKRVLFSNVAYKWNKMRLG